MRIQVKDIYHLKTLSSYCSNKQYNDFYIQYVGKPKEEYFVQYDNESNTFYVINNNKIESVMTPIEVMDSFIGSAINAQRFFATGKCYEEQE